MAVVVDTESGTVALSRGADWSTSIEGDLVVEDEGGVRIAQFATGRWIWVGIETAEGGAS